MAIRLVGLLTVIRDRKNFRNFDEISSYCILFLEGTKSSSKNLNYLHF